MKKITFLLLFALSASLSAQVTYTSADYAVAGEEIIISKAPAVLQGNFNFAVAGANHSWDFSALTAASQSTFSYDNPNNAGYKIAWCFGHGYLFNCNSQFSSNFNLATAVTNGIQFQNYGITNVVAHSKLSSASLETKMVGMTAGIGTLALPIAVDYTAPDVVYQFPIVFGDSYTSNGSFSVDMSSSGFPIAYASATTRTNTVEGWGSLVTPFTTFPNVLKMKTVLQTQTTITINGIQIPIPTTTVTYKWFDKNYGLPVLQADGVEVAGVFIPTSVTYIDGEQCLQPVAQFNVIPLTTDYNATTQSATVQFLNTSTNYNTIAWDFGDGGTSADVNPAHEFDCPGTHDVTLSITNTVCVPAVTTSVVIPVEITDSQNALSSEVTLSGNTLTATRNLPGTTYQWIDCDNANAAIADATSQSFTPLVSGNYACMISTNGCESTSTCQSVALLGNTKFNSSSVGLFPNPTTGKLQLSNDQIKVKAIEIYNILGTLVSTKLDLTNQPTGIYLVKIATEDNVFYSKVVKE